MSQILTERLRRLEATHRVSPAQSRERMPVFYGWAKLNKVMKGEACLSIRRWTGKPYRSEQYEMTRLTKDDGIGIQKLEFRKVFSQCRTVRPAVGDTYIDAQSLASNDGLSLSDWTSWFENYDKSKPLVIIHFTKFRY